MLNIIDLLVINTHIGNDVTEIIEDYQIANNCTQDEAVEALVDKIMELSA